MPTTSIVVLVVMLLTLGAMCVRLGVRLLFDKGVNPTGGQDNLAVTMLCVGIALIGWSGAGVTALVLRATG